MGTLSSGNGVNLHKHNGGTEHLSKVTSSKLKILTQPVLTQLGGHILRTDNGGTLGADDRGTERLSKVTSSNVKKLIQPVLI